ncbi:hypothetical protein FRC02_007964 [Tulasnella sp. 418]|nr:hypothetical protein FRC02_007964 [Tulasnella sp. 418]
MDFIEDTQETVHVCPHKPAGNSGASPTAERFDTVLVNEKGEAEITGTKGLRVAQVRVLFKLPNDICQRYFGSNPAHWPGHLAYIEWFSHMKSSPERDHGMFLVEQTEAARRLETNAAIIDISAITRSCHLIPQFFLDQPVRQSPAAEWTSQNVLEKCTTFFVNNWLNHQSYRIIW